MTGSDKSAPPGATSRTGLRFDFFVALVCLLAVIGLCSLASPGLITNDGAQYISTAEQILSRGSINTTTVYYEAQAQFGMPAKQTVWPPGVPALLALFVFLTGLSDVSAFSLINAFAHAGTVFILFRLLSYFFSGNKAVAAFVATLYLLYVWALNTVVGGSAEPLFTFLLMAAAGALYRASRSPTNLVGWWLLASSFVGLACAMRYIGVAFIGALGIIALGELRRSNWAQAARVRAMALIGPASLIFGVLIVRNLVLTGRMTGGPTNERGLTAAEYLLHTQWSLTEVLGGGQGWLFRIGVLAFLVTAIGFVFVKMRTFSMSEVLASKERLSIAAYGFLGTLITLALVYGLAATKSGLAVEGRYFIPCVPLLIASVAALWQKAPSIGTTHKLNPYFSFGFAAGALFLTVVNLTEFASLLRDGAAPRQLERNLEVVFDGDSLRSTLENAATIGSPVMSNQSQALHMVLRKPTLGVPESRLTPTLWTPALLVEFAQKFGVEYLVVFKDMPLGSPGGSDDYIWQLVGNEPAGVSVLHSDATIALYRIPQVRVTASRVN